jgi:hypothetical protein
MKTRVSSRLYRVCDIENPNHTYRIFINNVQTLNVIKNDYCFRYIVNNGKIQSADYQNINDDKHIVLLGLPIPNSFTIIPLSLTKSALDPEIYKIITYMNF